jgi:hypothetical protein
MQLAFTFLNAHPTFCYRDGIGLWRCNACLREVPCGCVPEQDRDDAPKPTRKHWDS